MFAVRVRPPTLYLEGKTLRKLKLGVSPASLHYSFLPRTWEYISTLQPATFCQLKKFTPLLMKGELRRQGRCVTTCVS